MVSKDKIQIKITIDKATYNYINDMCELTNRTKSGYIIYLAKKDKAKREYLKKAQPFKPYEKKSCDFISEKKISDAETENDIAFIEKLKGERK